MNAAPSHDSHPPAPSADSTMIARLEHPDVAERLYAAEDLGFAADPSSVPALVARLSHEPSRQVKDAILLALARIGGPGVGAVAVELLLSDDPLIRNGAVELLLRRGGQDLEALRTALRHPDKDVRKFAVDALAAGPDPGAAALLAAALCDADPNVVIAALEQVGRAPHRDLREDVERILGAAAEPMLIVACLETLGHLGDPASLPAIRRRYPEIRRAPAYLRGALIRVLTRIGGADDVEDLVRAIAPEGEVHAAIILEALIAIRARNPAAADSDSTRTAARPLAASLLNAADPAARLAAIRAIHLWRHPEDQSLLWSRLESEPDAEVREALRLAVGLLP